MPADEFQRFIIQPKLTKLGRRKKEEGRRKKAYTVSFLSGRT
ncbi:hypothetical protein [Phormidium nigroviride]